MASNPEDLRKLRASYSVVYLQIIKISASDANALNVCVEGKDAPFYKPRLLAVVCRRDDMFRVHFHNCGGKAAVLSVREAVERNQSLQNALVVYAVDRDFSDPNEYRRDDTFVTCGYSVENYFIGSEVIRRVVEEYIYNEKVDPEASAEIADLISAYEKLEHEYFTAIAPFNAFAYALRSHRDPHIRLKAFDTSGFIKIDLASETVSLDERLGDFDEAVGIAHDRLTEDELRTGRGWVENWPGMG